MKCQACNFDDNEKVKRESWEEELKFYEVEGHFTAIKDNGGWHERRIEITVYACPKCGTLRTDGI